MKKSDLRDMIKEILLGQSLSDEELLMPKKEWEEEKKELRKNMVDLLKHIEDEEYEQGVDKINQVVSQLSSWKTKIKKFLD